MLGLFYLPFFSFPSLPSFLPSSFLLSFLPSFLPSLFSLSSPLAIISVGSLSAYTHLLFFFTFSVNDNPFVFYSFHSLHMDTHINTETEAFLTGRRAGYGCSIKMGWWFWCFPLDCSPASGLASPAWLWRLWGGSVMKQAPLGRTGLEANWPRAPPPAPPPAQPLGLCRRVPGTASVEARGVCEGRAQVCPWGSAPA